MFDFHFLAVVFLVTGMPIWLAAIAGCMWGYWDLKGEKIVQEKEVPVVFTEKERKEERRYLMGIAIVFLVMFIGGFGDKLYGNITKKELKIPAEWQQQLANNQNIINEAKKKLKKAEADSSKILDKIVILNKVGTSGKDFMLEMRNNKWRLYKK